MIDTYIYFAMMISMFVFFMVFGCYLYWLDMSVSMEWLVAGWGSFNLEVLVYLDWVSLVFMSLIMLISSMVMMYSVVYMEEEVNIKRFILLVILFILSMMLMIISPNIVSILFGWDGLGLSSYCLVIFYSNYSSFNSGMVTVLSNRIGDIGMLMVISLLAFSGSWSLMFNGSFSGDLMTGLLMVAAITKSAQMPFSSWLPMAMAAPTPVSALVHSSTLVTAGVYLMIRFSGVIMGNNKFSNILLFLSVITMFMAGVMANIEVDLKKIIALSTLSQLGLMMMILSIGHSFLSFYHLMIHAIFKSMLFMCAGVMIHSMGNNQDIRMFGGLKEYLPYTMMSFFISMGALCGVPFMSGFYSKDLVMEMVYFSKINMVMMILILLSLMFTVSYSVRLYYYMFFSEVKFFSCVNMIENNIMNISLMLFMFLSVILGSVFNWMFFFDMYIIYLSFKIKFITMEVCLIGGMMGILMSFLSMLKIMYISHFLGSMWFLSGVYISLNKLVGVISDSFYAMDKTWMEFSFWGMVVSVSKCFEGIFYYKVYMFVQLFIFMCLIMILLY